MHVEKFEQLLERRIDKLRTTVLAKRAEYAASGADVLHNFMQAAKLLRISPAQVCVGYFAKHLVSIVDALCADKAMSEASVDEKVGDIMVYLTCLEAILTENREKNVG